MGELVHVGIQQYDNPRASKPNVCASGKFDATDLNISRSVRGSYLYRNLICRISELEGMLVIMSSNFYRVGDRLKEEERFGQS